MAIFESKSPVRNFDDPREMFVVRACRLPWSATAESVAKIFSDCNIRGGAKNGIHFTYSSEGHPSGECFVELVSRGDMEKALAKSKNSLGKRFVQVFKSTAAEMEQTCKRMGQPQDRGNEAVVRLRGLPFQVSKEEIEQFFTGLEIVPNGIKITLDEDGRTTGDAFVEFASPELASQAMKKNKESIRRRKIRILKNSKADTKYVSKPKRKPGPYDGRRFRGRRGPVFGGGYGGDCNGYGGGRGSSRGGRGGCGGRGGRGGFHNQGQSGGGGNFGSMSSTGHTVHMRGLPFAAKKSDVKRFFMPLNPVNIWMEYSGGSFRGQVDVDFASHEDAQAAMLKNKQSMGHRYIELFLRSQPDMEDVSGRGWAGSESGGQNFGSGNSGGDNFSENFGENFNVEDNCNFGGAGSSFGGNQTNIGGFGGQVNQSSGFSSPQPQQQQQQSNFSNQMEVGGDNFSRNNFGSGNFGGNFNAGDNYRNFGGAGSSFGGNQTNIGGFGGQANQSSGFNSPQPQQQQQQQQQQSNFSNQMGVGGGGGSFGNQGNSFSSNAGAFNAGPSPGGGNYSAQSSYGQTTGFSGSGFGGQMSSGLSTGMTTAMNTGMNTGSYAAQASAYSNPTQQSTPFNQQQQQQQQQQQAAYGDASAYGASASASYFANMQTPIKQEPQSAGTAGMVSYPGYQ
ncbi:PREDICTED: heterogeneous nuclear ribonucleoprotein H-like isoform X2 [Acropora digitifera]|uniref:heterogeneous nuclear ribonucleoprotein H-like isoform X2 n=1 Tax=Acropora digitifera TaxID=70779 RepID=UPI00077A372A|nr:PREDICTED: heterogeneous nuclear ribonucleoprotein H-like isoform X2 [Acropora digitifera]